MIIALMLLLLNEDYSACDPPVVSIADPALTSLAIDFVSTVERLPEDQLLVVTNPGFVGNSIVVTVHHFHNHESVRSFMVLFNQETWERSLVPHE